MDDAAAVRHQYQYDPETGEWLWRNAPAKAPLSKAAPGMPAGSIDKRDGSLHLNLGKKICRASRLAWLYVHGEWPTSQVLYRDPELPVPSRDRLSNLKLAGVEEELTQERVLTLLAYNPETGDLLWRVSRKGVRSGTTAAGLKNTGDKNAYLYVRIDGVDYPAQRLIWLYVNGFWPASRIAFADGDTKNLRLDNLSESGFEHGTRQTPTISEEDRKTRLAAAYRRADLKRHFNLTAEEYQQMHDAQDGKCAICDREETDTRGGKVKWLAVDHDHTDGHVRQLLCRACNVMIGNAGDDPARLRAAAAYLERHLALAAESEAA